KDKLSSLDEDTWNINKIQFDNSSYPFQNVEAGGVQLATSHAYRLPEAVRRVGVSPEVFVDRERMGVAIPELGPIDPGIVAPYGLSYTDASSVDLWWSQNAFATWPVVPLTLQTMEA